MHLTTTPPLLTMQAEAITNVMIFMKWTDDVRETGQPLSKLERRVRSLAHKYFSIVFWDPEIKQTIKHQYKNLTYSLGDKNLQAEYVMPSLHFLYSQLGPR